MATDTRRYPSIPARTYWDLRQRFINAPPRELNKDYLSTALGLGDKVAANTMPSIKTLGLVDDDNRPTDLAQKWRDDQRYTEATREIIEAVYPQALRDVSPPDAPDLEAAQRWFLNETKAGRPRANQLAAFYVLLASGERGSAQGSAPRRSAADRSTTSTPRATQRTSRTRAARNSGGSERDTSDDSQKVQLPSMSVAVQVYIDKDMTPEQVDHVFESMAKHLYGKQ